MQKSFFKGKFKKWYTYLFWWWHNNVNISKQSFQKCFVHNALFPLLIAATFSLTQLLPLPQKDRFCLFFQIYLLGKSLLNMYWYTSLTGLVNAEYFCFLIKEKTKRSLVWQFTEVLWNLMFTMTCHQVLLQSQYII